jgi:hypothetical protein
MLNISPPRRRHEGEDMRTALNRVGAALDRAYAEYCRRKITILTLLFRSITSSPN